MNTLLCTCVAFLAIEICFADTGLSTEINELDQDLNSTETEAFPFVLDEIQQWPTPDEFARLYMGKRLPVVMKKVADEFPAAVLWIDGDFLAKQKTSMRETGSLNTSYFKRGGPLDYFRTDLYHAGETFEDFIEANKTDLLAMVTTIPPYLRTHIEMPCPIQCPKLRERDMMDVFMWYGRKQISTKIHTDAGDIMYCGFKGEMSFVLFDPADTKKLYLEKVDNTVSDMHTPVADELNVKTFDADVGPGDCIYIPANTPYYVETSESIIAFSTMWKYFSCHVIGIEGCNEKCDDGIGFNSVDVIGYANVEVEIQKSKDYVKLLRESNTFDMAHLAMEKELQGICQFALNDTMYGDMVRVKGLHTLDVIDTDKNRRITDMEVSAMTKYDWLDFWHMHEHVLGMIDHMNEKHTGRHDEL